MPKSIVQAVSNSSLFNTNTPILVACSGGRDSMVLLHAFLQADFNNIYVAHCNFKLRGKESDDDQKFVEEYCKNFNLPFFTIDFETESYAKTKGISTQMAARELRYPWLEKIRKENLIHLIAVAHHQDDQIETVFLQILQGTGIRGLKGMLPKNDKIIRPLLGQSRDRINQYVKEHQVPYREDSSNISSDYKRNFFRNEISPLFEKINSNYLQEVYDFTQRMHESAVIFDEQVQRIRTKVLHTWKEGYKLDIYFLINHPACNTLFYEILHPFNLNKEQVTEIIQTIQGHKRKNASGQTFLSSSHRFILDRNALFILPLNTQLDYLTTYSKWPNQIIFNEYKISIQHKPINKVHIKNSKRYAYIDADKVTFPLTIRYPQAGDYFYPIGMNKTLNSERVGKKKVTKYFKDEKIALAERERTPIIFSEQKLLWLVGHRLDNRFKITDDTKEVIVLTINKP